MAVFTRAANAGDLSPGRCKSVTVAGVDVALCNVEGRFYAVDNTCPHRGGPLGEGDLVGHLVQCPIHGWRFDVRDGTSPTDAGSRVSAFPVRVENDEILVDVSVAGANEASWS